MTAAEKEYGGALYSLAVDEHLEDTLLAGLDAEVLLLGTGNIQRFPAQGLLNPWSSASGHWKS